MLTVSSRVRLKFPRHRVPTVWELVSRDFLSLSLMIHDPLCASNNTHSPVRSSVHTDPQGHPAKSLLGSGVPRLALPRRARPQTVDKVDPDCEYPRRGRVGYGCVQGGQAGDGRETEICHQRR